MRAMPNRWRAGWIAACAVVACSTTAPLPPEHFTRLSLAGDTGAPAIGVSTEVGVVLLATPGMEVGAPVAIRFPFLGATVTDTGTIARHDLHLAVVQPSTARLMGGRFATDPPTPAETLYLALRDEMDAPLMAPARLWQDGQAGDFIVIPERNARDLARDWAGTGLYVFRSKRWEIVGVLSSLVARLAADPQGEVAVGFYGLGELARISPGPFAFMEHDAHPLRPDLEFGLPFDGAGGQGDAEQ